jgi:hypothetical protein
VGGATPPKCKKRCKSSDPSGSARSFYDRCEVEKAEVASAVSSTAARPSLHGVQGRLSFWQTCPSEARSGPPPEVARHIKIKLSNYQAKQSRIVVLMLPFLLLMFSITCLSLQRMPDSLWKARLCVFSFSSAQPSADHFQQSAEFLPLRNRGFGSFAVTVLPIPLARRATATACAAVQSTAPLFRRR